uniref:Centromere protein S n=1 Tax=Romanomermis culicivorax TaxID=13658 RepID=A0A915I9S2_ROMCU
MELLESHDSDEKVIEERLKTAIHYVVSKKCEEISKEQGIEKFAPTFVASLTECVFAVSKEWSSDLEAFANHAKRSTINFDDFKLLTRKNCDLQNIVQKHIDRKQEQSSTKTDTKDVHKKRTTRRNAKSAIMENDENSHLTHDDADTRPGSSTMDFVIENDTKCKISKLEMQKDEDEPLNFEYVQNFDEDMNLFDD